MWVGVLSLDWIVLLNLSSRWALRFWETLDWVGCSLPTVPVGGWDNQWRERKLITHDSVKIPFSTHEAVSSMKMLLPVKAEACKITEKTVGVVGRLCTTCRGALFQRREVCRDHMNNNRMKIIYFHSFSQSFLGCCNAHPILWIFIFILETFAVSCAGIILCIYITVFSSFIIQLVNE